MKGLTQPLNQIVGVVFVWVATVLSNVRNLASRNSITVGKRTISEKAIGIGLIALSTAGLAFQVWKSYVEYEEVYRLNEIIEDSSSILFNEASGGAVIKDIAYIVDDEKPRLFKLKLRVPEKGYEYTGDEIKLGDNIDDLEAIASKPDDKAPETVYVITSHSNNKKGEQSAGRQKLLEVSLALGSEGRITKSQEKLRVSIENIFDKLSNELPDENLKKRVAELKDEKLAQKAQDKGVIQIEGLAIDEDDYAYIGFRSPLVQKQEVKYALILRAKLSELFSDKPEFQPFLLNLWSDNASQGISSIDYDTQTKTLLLIGNDPTEQLNKPRLWQWYFSGETALIQNPRDRGLIYYPSGSARPELLLLPSKSVSDRIYTYLDTDGKGRGGQIVLERSKFSLEVK
jgi:hypothetical protein